MGFLRSQKQIFCLHKLMEEKTKKSIRAFNYFDLIVKKLICRKKRSKMSHFFRNKKNLYIPNLLL